MPVQLVKAHSCHGGRQEYWRHHSAATKTAMDLCVFKPSQYGQRPLPIITFLSGLTCTPENFTVKAAAQQHAERHQIILVAPDTSPRGDGVADADRYDLGMGAGFYVNATEEPWARNYQMYQYIAEELPAMLAVELQASDRRAIMGHSMGGHGALMIGLRSPQSYNSISAFSPICAPSHVPWGQEAFGAYLGNDRSTWTAYDSSELIRTLGSDKQRPPILVDQGEADEFLAEQLQPERLQAAAATVDYPCEVRMQAGYDHSYFFIQTFIGDHFEFHARHLT